jgi:hypothetical protein
MGGAMGLEIPVPRPAPFPLGPVLDRLAARGTPCRVVMVDNLLRDPGGPPPESWRDVRLKTPHGMVTVVARPGGTAVVVFGNAAELLQEDQRLVAEAIRETGSP